MKKMVFTVLLGASCGLAAIANGKVVNHLAETGNGKHGRSERPHSAAGYPDPVTESNFTSDFPDAVSVAWSQGAFTEAEFTEGGIRKTAYYDVDHTLVGTTEYMPEESLPAKARDYISRKYPGYEIKGVVYFHDNVANDTNMALFQGAFEDEDNYFPFLTKGNREIILKVDLAGEVSFFQNYR